MLYINKIKRNIQRKNKDKVLKSEKLKINIIQRTCTKYIKYIKHG